MRGSDRFRGGSGRHPRGITAVFFCAAFLGALSAGPALAQAAFPGTNGKLAFIRGIELFTVNLDGTGATRIASAESEAPNFNPNGTRIAFAQFTGSPPFELFTIGPDGTGQTPISAPGGVSETAPSYSPDGRRIAFVAFDGSDDEIYLMNADGSGTPTQFTDNTIDDGGPEFSPDGTKLAVESHFFDFDIWGWNLDGSGQPVNVSDHPSDDSSPEVAR